MSPLDDWRGPTGPQEPQPPVSLRRSSAYSAANTVLRLATTLVTIPLLIRILGVRGFGGWAVLVSIFTVASTLLQFGLVSAVSVHLPRAQADGDLRQVPQLLGTSLRLFCVSGGVAATLISASAPHLASVLHLSEAMASPTAAIVVMGLAAAAQLVKQWLIAVEIGLQRFDLQLRAESVSMLLLNIGLMLVALLGGQIIGMAAWQLVATCASIFLHRRAIRHVSDTPMSCLRHGSRHLARSLLRFGLAQWVSQLGGSLFGQADRLIVSVLLGPTAAGVYTAAASVVSRLNELSAAPLQAITPAIAASHAAGLRQRNHAIFQAADRLNRCVVFVLGAGVILGSTILATVLVPDIHRQELDQLLRVMAVSYAPFSMNAVGFFSAQGIGRPSINAAWTLSGGLVFVVMLLTLTPLADLEGAAWANVAFSITLGINIMVLRELGASWASHVRGVLTVLAGLGGCMLLRDGLPDALGMSAAVAAILAVIWTGAWVVRLGCVRLGKQALWRVVRAGAAAEDRASGSRAFSFFFRNREQE